MTSSTLIAQAIGIDKEPDFGPLSRAVYEMDCNYCCRKIRIGETYAFHNYREGFNNGSDMLPGGTGEICWQCNELGSRKPLNMAPYYKSVFNAKGVFSLMANDSLYSLLMKPEQLDYPCVILMGDATSQILSWRADVTLGPDLLKIQHGNNRLSIRTRHLHKMLEANALIGKKLAAKAGKKGFKFLCVFASINGKQQPVVNPGFRVDVIELAEEDAEVKDALAVILKSNLGEIWAFFKTFAAYAESQEVIPLKNYHPSSRLMPRERASKEEAQETD